jgi:hypothetical protein
LFIHQQPFQACRCCCQHYFNYQINSPVTPTEGDPKKFQQAGDTITQSILGLVIVAGAFILAGLVGRLTGINILSPTIYGP